MNVRATRVENEVLVRLKGPSLVAPQLGGEIVDRFDLPASDRAPGGPILQLRLQGESVDEALKRLSRDPQVAYAAANDILQSFGEPNDLAPDLWGMKAIHAPAAWDVTTGQREGGPIVATIDSGCDYNHPDLAANIWTNPGEIPGNGIDDDGNGVIDDVHGISAPSNSGDPTDDATHGTHVAGTIGAVGNNGLGVVGVNWQARIMPLRFLEGGYGETSDAIKALLYAGKMGARITSNSWGGTVYNPALRDALASIPALHICAAGNDGSDNDLKPVYPAGYDLPNLVAVGASTAADGLASFSNYGATTVDLVAPGDKITSTLPGGAYGVKSGTSMATPHVSGVAALVASRYPGISNQQLKDRLLFSVDATPAFEGKCVSGGRLNAASALEDDRVAPGALGGLQALTAEATPRGVPLTWTATGDDGDVGRAAGYELRFSNRPITDFEAASVVPAPRPGEPGSAQRTELRLHPKPVERHLFVAARAVDNVGNRGPVSQTEVTIPAADLAFSEDGESGTGQWTAEGTWGLQPRPEGGGFMWSDSPAGPYPEGANASLTSVPIDLSGLSAARLEFEARHDLENRFDNVFLEASRNGTEWKTLDTFNGLSAWTPHHYTLDEFAGGPVQLRFRLKTDLDECREGFTFDNLIVTRGA